jgi:hypothetical protein
LYCVPHWRSNESRNTQIDFGPTHAVEKQRLAIAMGSDEVDGIQMHEVLLFGFFAHLFVPHRIAVGQDIEQRIERFFLLWSRHAELFLTLKTQEL